MPAGVLVRIREEQRFTFPLEVLTSVSHFPQCHLPVAIGDGAVVIKTLAFQN